MKWKMNDQVAQHVNTHILHDFDLTELKKVRKFHETFSQYEMTPLRKLDQLAKYLNVKNIFVKDESYRFGLEAFKVLGGAYAIGKYVADRLHKNIDEVSFDYLRSDEVKNQLGTLTFISATDGNHGRGVAWAAQQLGQKAIIYLPKGTSKIRADHIKATGAKAYITDVNYDDTVRMCAELSEENGWIMLQDTAWEGYEEIPSWIMQGYTTMVAEAIEQINSFGTENPTHVFLQAGVGSYAASVQGYLSALYKKSRPAFIVVEPDKANCLYLSALSEDKEIKRVTGALDTIMAGLSCGEPNPKAWKILKELTDTFISCPDEVAAHGMRILGNPAGDDPRIISGESGAVTAGVLSTIMQNDAFKELRDQLQLNSESSILLINTEGDTDPENYRKIVWDGLYENKH